MFDEVAEEEEGEGLEGFEDQANQGKQPFDHVYETSFSTHVIYHLLSMYRNHVEMMTTCVGHLVSFILKLASSMTLPSYEGIAGGNR